MEFSRRVFQKLIPVCAVLCCGVTAHAQVDVIELADLNGSNGFRVSGAEASDRIGKSVSRRAM